MSSILPSSSSSSEPWVDLKTLAQHLGFGYQATAKMVKAGKIPGTPVRNGARTFWRFRLSDVDAAWQNSKRVPPE